MPFLWNSSDLMILSISFKLFSTEIPNPRLVFSPGFIMYIFYIGLFTLLFYESDNLAYFTFSNLKQFTFFNGLVMSGKIHKFGILYTVSYVKSKRNVIKHILIQRFTIFFQIVKKKLFVAQLKIVLYVVMTKSGWLI